MADAIDVVIPQVRHLQLALQGSFLGAWPVSARVNTVENDDAAILDRVEAAA